MEKSPYLCRAKSKQNTMVTQKKTPYYLIIEITGDVTRKNIPPITQIRGLYSTQAKAIAELFQLCSRLLDEGAIFVNEQNQNPDIPISEMIHSQTHNGETMTLGYIPNKNQIFELLIKPITPDICTLITT